MKIPAMDDELKKTNYTILMQQNGINVGVSALSMVWFTLFYLEIGKKETLLFLVLVIITTIVGLLLSGFININLLRKLFDPNNIEQNIKKIGIFPIINTLVVIWIFIPQTTLIVIVPIYLKTNNMVECVFLFLCLVSTGIMATAVSYVIGQLNLYKLLKSKNFSYIQKISDRIPIVSLKKQIIVVSINSVSYPLCMIASLLYYINCDGISLSNIKTGFIIVAVQTTLISIITSVILSNKIINSLNDLINTIKEISNGNLNVEALVCSRDEISILAKMFNIMANNLKTTIVTVENKSRELNDSFSKLESSTNQKNEVANGVAAVAQEIAATIQQMNATMGNIRNSTINISEEMNRSYQSILKFVDESNKVYSLSKNGELIVVDTMDRIGSIEIAFTEIDINVKSLAEFSTKIDEFINVIKEIAAQTNVLALNASVEAAKAGERGTGFAVIAIEIKKLAQSATDSSKEMQNIIKKIYYGIQKARESTSKGKEEVQRGVSSSIDSGRSLSQINEAIKGSINTIVSIENSSKDINCDLGKIVDHIITTEGALKNITKAAEDLAENANLLSQSTMY